MEDLKTYVVEGVTKTDFINHEKGSDPESQSVVVRAKNRCQAQQKVRSGVLLEQNRLFCARGVRQVGAQKEGWEEASKCHEALNWDEPWYEQPIVAVDVETTGLDPFESEVIEMGWAFFNPDKQTFEDPHSQLIKPKGDMGATHIHGIEKEDVADKPEFEDILEDVTDLLSGVLMVAQNRGFDVRMLQAELNRYSDEPVSMPPSLCTKAIANNCPSLPSSPGLSELASIFGVTLDNHHRAGADAKACGDIFRELAKRIEHFHPPCTLKDAIDYVEQLEW